MRHGRHVVLHTATRHDATRHDAARHDAARPDAARPDAARPDATASTGASPFRRLDATALQRRRGTTRCTAAAWRAAATEAAARFAPGFRAYTLAAQDDAWHPSLSTTRGVQFTA
jgi:hypothetical protein